MASLPNQNSVRERPKKINTEPRMSGVKTDDLFYRFVKELLECHYDSVKKIAKKLVINV
jgi:hypothetical protein